jgi:hypothetical protein
VEFFEARPLAQRVHIDPPLGQNGVNVRMLYLVLFGNPLIAAAESAKPFAEG